MKNGNWKDFETELTKTKLYGEKGKPENIIQLKEVNRVQLLKI